MGLLSDMLGGVKVKESVYQASDETNIFSGLMDALLETAGTIAKDAFSNAVRSKNEGLKSMLGGIASIDSELQKGPLTYSTSSDYQAAAADATSSIQTLTGTNVAAERQILADEVNLVSGDLKKAASNIKTHTRNLANIEGVDMADEKLSFLKKSANAAIGQSFFGGLVGGMMGQMKENYSKTGGLFSKEVMQDGKLGYEGMFGFKGFTPYEKPPSNLSNIGKTKKSRN